MQESLRRSLSSRNQEYTPRVIALFATSSQYPRRLREREYSPSQITESPVIGQAPAMTPKCESLEVYTSHSVASLITSTLYPDIVYIARSLCLRLQNPLRLSSSSQDRVVKHSSRPHPYPVVIIPWSTPSSPLPFLPTRDSLYLVAHECVTVLGLSILPHEASSRRIAMKPTCA
jgi:hypothetical protein